MEGNAKGKKGFACLLALLLAVATAFMPIAAWAEGSSSNEPSVSVSLTSDQASYQKGGEATFGAVIANEGEDPVNEVSYSLELPSGMTVVEGSSLTGDLGTIAPGDSVEVTVKALVEGIQPLATPNALASTGDFSALPILGGMILLAAIVALFASKKSRNITLSIVLICGMSGILGAGTFASTAYAAERNSVFDSIPVMVDGSDSSATMIIFYAAGSSQQPSGGEGGSSGDEGGASITRAQWVEKLLAAAGIQVSEDAKSPYIDISGHSSEKAIATAYKLGAFVDEQTEFAPESPATREFALTSSVLIAGFHDDGSTLEAADADKASCPSLLAIAVDLGMANIDDQGNIRPQDAISPVEADSVLEALVSVLAPDPPSEDGISIELQDDVISVDEYEMSSDGSSYLVPSSENAIVKGDMIALAGNESNPQGAAGVVTSVKPVDETTYAVTIDQADSPEQIFDSIRIVSNGLTPNAEDVVLAEDVEWDVDAVSFARESATTRKLNFKVKLSENESLKVSVQPTFDVDIDWSLFGGFKKCNVETGVEFSTSCSSEFASIGGKPKKLATIPVQIVPGVISLDCELYLHVEASGKISLDAKASLASGIKLKGDHWRTYIDGDSEVSAQLEAKAEIGVAPAAAIAVFSVNVVDLSVEAGIAGEGSVTQRDTGMVCNDIALYLYDKLTVGEHSPILEAMGLTASWDLWTKSNSPFSWDLHAENGQFVNECTYGQENPADPSVPGDPSVVTPAEDFVYAVGDYIWNGTVMKGELPSGEGINIEPGYGSQFEGSVENTSPSLDGGYTVSGNDCGYGVYITDYIGTDSTVVIPDQIDGIDVVYVGIQLVKPASSLDVSHCSGLKSLHVVDANRIEFGAIGDVLDVGIQGGQFTDVIDMSSLSKLESLVFYWVNMPDFKVSKASLKAFSCMISDIENIDVSNAPLLEEFVLGEVPNLRELDISNDPLLEELEVGTMPSLTDFDCSNCNLSNLDFLDLSILEVLNCSGNRIVDTSRLEEWLAQPGHSGTITPQREVQS